MPFSTRTSNQVLQGMLNRLTKETSINATSPGSIARALYDIIAEEIAFDFRLFESNTSQLFLSSAGGTALDAMGSLYGVTRNSSVSQIDSNTGSVYFYINSSATHEPGVSDSVTSVPVVIPVGTIISTAELSTNTNPVSWRTTAACTIPTGEYIAYASVEPITYDTYTVSKGSVRYSNLPLDTTLTGYVYQQNYPGVYVYNRTDLQAKPTLESDTNYRYRISNAIQLAATGNLLAIRLAALGTTGVRDCIVTPYKYGVGTVGVTIILEDPGSGSAATYYGNAVTNVDAAKSAGDIVISNRPSESVVDITINLVTSTGTSAPYGIARAAEAAIKRYINTLSVGDPIIYSKIINESMSVSPQIRDVAIIDGGLRVNGVAVSAGNITPKVDEQFFPGTITAN